MAERVVAVAGAETDKALEKYARDWVLVAVIPVTKPSPGLPMEYRELYFERQER